MIDIVYLRPLDLSVDETLHDIEARVHQIGAKRVVIDSLSGFEIALAPSFRQDFRESFYRLVQAFTQLNITVLSTMETAGDDSYLRFSPYSVSFLSDDILAMRYIELDGELRTILSVIKMRGSEHSRALRVVEVTSRGIEIRQELSGYRGIITGVPEPRLEAGSENDDAGYSTELTPETGLALDALLRLGETSAAKVADSTGLTLDLVVRVLEQLSATQYVVVSERSGETVYRAARGARRRPVSPE
jgi:hypothetical protein